MYTILIVDDKEIFRRQFKRFSVFSASSRFQVRFEAQNGREALELLRREQIDILITDIRMPIMDGIELLRRAKEDGLCPCIILLSEYADFANAKQGIVLGAFDYVVKPIHEEALGALLERCECHLKAYAQGNEWDNNAQRILPELLLKNDDYSATFCNRLAERVLSADPADPQKVWEAFSTILREVKQKILAERAHIANYCALDELCMLEKQDTAISVAARFCERIANLQQEVNKFAVQSKSELIQSVCNLMVKNIENGLSLQSVANLHFVNKAYLSHLIRQELGMSFVDFLSFVKMERAKILLRSEQKIYEIASRLDYADTEYFSRVFKQHTGFTPTEYRQNRLQEGRGN